jgi:hypothetical protein
MLSCYCEKLTTTTHLQVAGHDLKSLAHCFNVGTSLGLRLPLMALVHNALLPFVLVLS